jgi:hypothetical protein
LVAVLGLLFPKLVFHCIQKLNPPNFCLVLKIFFLFGECFQNNFVKLLYLNSAENTKKLFSKKLDLSNARTVFALEINIRKQLPNITTHGVGPQIYGFKYKKNCI